jgi:hypothetical protein
MAARAKDRQEPDPGGVQCAAERLQAVLIVLEQATDPNRELAGLLEEGELQLALTYALMPVAVQMSRELVSDLGRLDELYVRRPAVQETAS